MRKNKLLLKEEINRLVELSGESLVTGKHLVVVDIQPDYYDGFSYFFHDFINFINDNFNSLDRLTFLFNGPDLGFPSESEYKWWWIENGLNEEIIENSSWFDKGYAFFRYCIDSGIDDEEVVALVKFMINNNINDSKDITEEFWNEFIEEYNFSDVRDLLEISDDCINIPELMNELRPMSNIVVCGGGINECLKEVEIALQALDKPYNVLTKFVY